MQRWRSPCVIAVLSALLAPAESAAANLPSDADITRSFEANITHLDAMDPRAPQALETHLRYAEYLAQQQEDNCAARLTAAQVHLQAAQQNVALSVVLPQGLARAADIDYQIHTALAACGDPSDALHREAELRAAQKSAQRAASLYQDTFDYPAMVTMLFNAALTYQSLGQPTAAQTALQSVIDADRRYGFRDDAKENYALLLRWQSGDPDQVAVLMKDFPQRSTTLTFAWAPGDNAVTLTAQSTRVKDNEIVNASGDRTLKRQVRRRPFGWIVTYQSLDAHYSLKPPMARTSVEPSFMASLASMVLQFHDFSLSDTRTTLGTTADFNETINRDSFKARAQQEANAHQEADSLLGTLQPQGTDIASLSPMLNTVLNDLLLPRAVDADAALDYNLETGAWANATLEQGEWYGMKLLLPLPYSPQNFVLHEVQFAFTRELPCNHDSDRTCVELVLRAIPEQTALNRTLGRLQRPLHLRHGATLRSWSTMSMRLVTDPTTLQAYERDTQQQFYVSLDFAGNGALLGADQTIIDSEPVKPAAD